ncbi:putative Sperm tail PG rich repeat [Trypanosoma vivax]|nr:putative Sperm tail PG rich repeat [Trypanosoma vivax]
MTDGTPVAVGHTASVDAVDIKRQAEALYARILTSVDMALDNESTEVNALDDRVSPSRPLPLTKSSKYVYTRTRKTSLSSGHCTPNEGAHVGASRARVCGDPPMTTFGHGRNGLCNTSQKKFSSAQKSDFNSDTDDSAIRKVKNTGPETKRLNSHSNTNSANGGDSVATKLRQQFEETCQCYWRQFLEVGISLNPAAHASGCPCQAIKVYSAGEVVSMCSADGDRGHGPRSKHENSRGKSSGHLAARSASYTRGVSGRSAIFGTSPRCTVFTGAGHSVSSTVHQRSEGVRRKRCAGAKSVPPKTGASIDEGSAPSYLRPTKRAEAVHCTSPGPGAYDVTDGIGTTGRSSKNGLVRGLSIGRAKRTLHTVTDVPGPGAYCTDLGSLKADNRSLGDKKIGRMSTSKRRLLIVPEEKVKPLPGPGDYNPESASLMDARHKSSPVFSFSRDKVSRSGRTLFGSSPVEVRPGPGSYDLLKNDKGPAYTLGQRPVERMESTPGPGQYELAGSTTGPQWILTGRRPSNHARESVPGPGNYFVTADSLGHSHSSAPLFSTAPRKLHAEAEGAEALPGPGTYDTGVVNVPARTIFMGISQRVPAANLESSNDVPGPGAYSSQYTTQEPRVASPFFATTNQYTAGTPSESNALAPGPGYYDTTNLTNWSNVRSTILGTAPRVLSLNGNTDEIGAGPGSYDVTVPKDGPSFSIGRRIPVNATQADASPGPGLYMPQNINCPSSPSAVIGGASRFQQTSEEKHLCDAPGPGAYVIEPSSAKPKGAAFGVEPRRLQTDLHAISADKAYPGPGSYDPQKIKSRPPGVVLGTGERFSDNREDEAPGPGAYGQQSHTLTPHSVMFDTFCGKSSDWLVSAAAGALPGPGSYSPRNFGDRAHHGAVFGISPRHVPSQSEKETQKRTSIGPGHYDPEDVRISSRSAVFGIASRPQEMESNEDLPGPGAYSPLTSGVCGSPNGPVSFSTAPRFSRAMGAVAVTGTDDTPGPGSYSVEQQKPCTAIGGVVGFGSGPRTSFVIQGDPSSLPGPGQYEVGVPMGDSKSCVHSFGVGSRTTAAVADEGEITPGPGAYDIKYSTSSTPFPSFGVESRNKGIWSPTEGPGPGTYNVKSDGDTGPGYRFAVAPRKVHAAADETPGPGQYFATDANCAPRQCTGAPCFSLKAPRFEPESDGSHIPGPGQYSPYNPKWEAAQAYSFSLVGRNHQGVGSDVPGPGTYSPQGPSPSSGSPTFGMGSRLADAISVRRVEEDYPGPGHYNVVLPAEGPSVRIGTAGRDLGGANETGAFPGPGAYDPQVVENSGPALIMSRVASRDDVIVKTDKLDNPGPGTYTLPPGFPSVDGAGKGTLFLKSSRFSDSSSTSAPGPGTYTAELPREAVGHSIGRAPRLTQKSVENLPGPGSYDIGEASPATNIDGGVALRYVAPRFSEDVSTKQNETPGPASYSPPEPRSLSPGVPFSHASRFPEAGMCAAETQPGPGEYSIPSIWETTRGGCSFSFGPRLQTTEAISNTPGPGDYDVGVSESQCVSVPSLALHGKPTYAGGGSTTDVPGPGSYSPRPVSTTRTVTLGAPPTIDPNILFTIRANETPGPAAYNIPNTLGQKAIVFGKAERSEPQTFDDVPGPGTYLTGGPVVLPCTPAFSFGSAPRPGFEGNHWSDAPGPGDYHQPFLTKSSAPSFTFATTDRFKEAQGPSDLGPGEYYHPDCSATCLTSAPSFPIAARMAAS